MYLSPFQQWERVHDIERNPLDVISLHVPLWQLSPTVANFFALALLPLLPLGL
jgi:hypothetical protein